MTARRSRKGSAVDELPAKVLERLRSYLMGKKLFTESELNNIHLLWLDGPYKTETPVSDDYRFLMKRREDEWFFITAKVGLYDGKIRFRYRMLK